MNRLTLNPHLIGRKLGQTTAEHSIDENKLQKIVNRTFFLVFLHAGSSIGFWQLLKRNIVDNVIQNNFGIYLLASFFLAFAWWLRKE